MISLMLLPANDVEAVKISWAKRFRSIPAIFANFSASTRSVGVAVGELKFTVSDIIALHNRPAILLLGTNWFSA